MPDIAPVTLAQENLFSHVAFAPASLPGMACQDLAGRGSVCLVDSGLPSDTFNKVLWNCGRDLCAAPVSANDAVPCLRAAAAHIEASGRDFSLWARADASLPTFPGLLPQESESAMFLPLHASSGGPLTPHFTSTSGLRLLPAETPALIEAFASVLAANWSPADEAVFAFYRAATPLLLQDQAPMRLFVALAGDRPLACGELFLSHGGQTAGLHSICTLEPFRCKGFGTTMSAALLRAGQAAGANVAVLLASAAGAPVYHKLGFAHCGLFQEFAFTEEVVHA